MERRIRKGCHPELLLIVLLILFSWNTAECEGRSYFAVQVASHKKISDAKKEILRLQQKGYDAFFKKTDIPGKGVWYRIYIGKFTEKNKARALSKKLKALKIADFTMIHEFKDPVTIGVIDTPRIIRDSIAGKRAQVEYLRFLEAKRAYFGSIQDKYLEREDSFKQEEDDLPPKVKEETVQKLTEEKKELLRLKGELEKELKEKDEELKTALLKEIKEIINRFEEEEKHRILIEEKAAIVIDDTVDFTGKIIELYDADQDETP